MHSERDYTGSMVHTLIVDITSIRTSTCSSAGLVSSMYSCGGIASQEPTVLIIMMKRTRDNAHTAVEVANMQRIVANMATFTLDPNPLHLVMILIEHRGGYETNILTEGCALRKE